MKEEVEVNYALGCGITSLFTDSISAAVEVAKNSDAVILVLGGTSQTLSGIGWGDPNSKELATCGEGYDRNELDFPGVQPQLLDAIAATGKPIVLVMINGRPLTIGDEADKVDAARVAGRLRGCVVHVPCFRLGAVVSFIPYRFCARAPNANRRVSGPIRQTTSRKATLWE